MAADRRELHEEGAMPAGGGLSSTLGMIVVSFVLALFPFAAHFVTFHPDERHYTDGALQMLERGDYDTPRTADGSLRFNKPVLTYWLLLPGYLTLGTTPLAGRIAFLLLSALVVALTHRTALLLYHNARTALWAAAIMATHAPLLSVAVNSLPEVPLALCWLLCAYGFLGITVLGKRDAIFYWAAYGGAGLGVAVKGMPILILVAYAWLFAVGNPWKRTAVRELCHAPSLACGAFVALWWYLAMYAEHGNAAIVMFMNDQVTDRVDLAPWQFVKNAGLVLACYLVTFLPWNLPLLRRWATAARSPGSLRLPRFAPPGQDVRATMVVAFVVGWACVMGVVIALVERFAVRYLLAVTPLLAVVVADQMARAPEPFILRINRRASALLASLIAIIALLLIPIHAQLQVPLTLTGFALLVAGLGLWLCWPENPWRIDASVRLTLAALSLLPLGFLVLQPIALPDSGTMFAQQAEAFRFSDRSDLVYAGNPALVSKSRVAADGALSLTVLDDVEDLTLPEYPRVLLRADNRHMLPPEHYEVEREFTAGVQSYRPLPLVAALLQGRLRDYTREHAQRFVVLRQRQEVRLVSHSEADTATR
jgi:4-amino-4-deoxy-L-arabinose transferase-like glycosyltransferase